MVIANNLTAKGHRWQCYCMPGHKVLHAVRDMSLTCISGTPLVPVPTGASVAMYHRRPVQATGNGDFICPFALIEGIHWVAHSINRRVANILHWIECYTIWPIQFSTIHYFIFFDLKREEAAATTASPPSWLRPCVSMCSFHCQDLRVPLSDSLPCCCLSTVSIFPLCEQLLLLVMLVHHVLLVLANFIIWINLFLYVKGLIIASRTQILWHG